MSIVDRRNAAAGRALSEIAPPDVAVTLDQFPSARFVAWALANGIWFTREDWQWAREYPQAWMPYFRHYACEILAWREYFWNEEGAGIRVYEPAPFLSPWWGYRHMPVITWSQRWGWEFWPMSQWRAYVQAVYRHGHFFVTVRPWSTRIATAETRWPAYDFGGHVVVVGDGPDVPVLMGCGARQFRGTVLRVCHPGGSVFELPEGDWIAGIVSRWAPVSADRWDLSVVGWRHYRDDLPVTQIRTTKKRADHRWPFE